MLTDANAPNSAGRLDSWKEIAAYLGKAIRTVQRWERSEGLPVHRFGQDRTGPVFAYKSELDVWWQQQSQRLMPEAESAPASEVVESGSRKRWLFLVAGTLIGVAALSIAIGSIRQRPVEYRPVPFTADHGWESQPSFSPDGTHIVFTSGASGSRPFVYIKAVGGDARSRLTTGTQPENQPAWSPDGRSIAFLRYNAEGGPSLMLIPAAGGPETQIARLALGDRLVWSRDGRWIVTSDGVEKRRVLLAISVSTGQHHFLTKPYDFRFCGFGLTPDMKRLIYCEGGPGSSTIVELGLSEDLKPAGNPRILSSRVWVQEMILTPDAKRMIYTDGSYGDGVGLWRRKLTAESPAELIHGTSDKYSSPAVSPDEHRLAFAVSRSSHDETWKLKLDGSPGIASRVLSSTHSDLNPDYSPDGRHIAFHSTRSGASEIWVADPEGGNARRLTSTKARMTATPRWSPDGGWIAYESTEKGDSDVYVIRSNGGPAQRLTFNPATDAIPNWSRDGKSIYFCSNRTGRYEIWRVPAFGGEQTQMTRDGGFAAVESPDGKYLYYSQTRNYGPVWRMPLPDGKAELIIPEFRGLFYAVSTDGVYFQAKRTIRFWDAATKQTREIYKPQKPIGYGMAVSPDGKELLFTQGDLQETDIYLIDGLR